MFHISNLLYKPLLKIQKIKYGKYLSLYGLPLIVKDKTAEIQIGQNCHIRSSFFSNLIGLSQRTIIVAREDGIIKIGRDVGISGATIYARKGITIGDQCIIGGNVKILDNDFHPIDPQIRLETPCKGYGMRPICIGKNVFIGCNSIILKGVVIGDGAVIGAGSVVSKDVASHTLVAGNPAVFIKRLLSIEEDYGNNNDINTDI